MKDNFPTSLSFDLPSWARNVHSTIQQQKPKKQEGSKGLSCKTCSHPMWEVGV